MELKSIFTNKEQFIPPHLGIDKRSLNIFRMGLALVVITDLLLRSRNITAFYTDSGVLPRGELFSDYNYVYSLHALFEDPTSQLLLLILSGLLALSLLIGYHPNTSAFLLWLMTLSLQSRNPLVLNSGDDLLVLLLLWASFLPYSKQKSLKNDIGSSKIITTPATVGILFQIWLVYFINAIVKIYGNDWMAGNGLEMILNLGQFTVLLGPHLADIPLLPTVFNYMWLTTLTAATILLFTKKWIRALITTCLIGGHIFIFMTVRIGVFPVVSILSLILFYPPFIWDWISNTYQSLIESPKIRHTADGIRTNNTVFTQLKSYYPNIKKKPLDSPLGDSLMKKVKPIVHWVIPLIVLIIIVTATGNAMGAIHLSESTEEQLQQTRVDQYWVMFAPNPPSSEVWYVAPGKLSNGSTIDAYQGGKVDYSRPSRVDQSYETARWRKYLENIRKSKFKHHTDNFGQYLCTRWNENHDTQMKNVSIYTVSNPAIPSNTSRNPQTTKQLQTTVSCNSNL